MDRDHLPTIIQAFNAGKELGLISHEAARFTPSAPRQRNIFSEIERAVILSNVFIKNFEYDTNSDESISWYGVVNEIPSKIGKLEILCNHDILPDKIRRVE